ncbi:hypothetical protein QBC38DRAFT_279143 [Podospora fimiseda]|uniref:Uncharacterized protein n=1 Tax=Podospora fimiseda TaxID=252190 RepID=A0AAN7BX43_9PEZI|nr:hypothetical protein QBC38DRAFT_279143 [Podospora fimiseda]
MRRTKLCRMVSRISCLCPFACFLFLARAGGITSCRLTFQVVNVLVYVVELQIEVGRGNHGMRWKTRRDDMGLVCALLSSLPSSLSLPSLPPSPFPLMVGSRRAIISDEEEN